MEYLVGVGVAALVCVFGMVCAFDRDRVFYPTVLIVVASYYILFAAMGSTSPVMPMELVGAGVFLLAAVVGFRKNLWFAAVGLCGHGVFDFFHHLLIQNPGVPGWWPGFCLGFDVPAGIYLAVLLVKRSGFALPGGTPREAGRV